MSLSQCHFDKPTSHSQVQTRWTLPAGKKIFAPSVKLLDIALNPNKPSYFPALVGAYACVKRIQLRLNNRLVDLWTSQAVLPYLIAQSGDNEKQFGINSVLYGTGNNVKYDPTTKLLTLERPLVDANKATIKLPIYLDLLNNIGIIDDSIEIIIDWEQSISKLLCPVDPEDPATEFTIDAPFLSYETLNGDYSQPDNVPYRMWLNDQFAVPSIDVSGTMNQYEVRSNAFNKKTLGRMMLVNTPSSINSGNPNTDAETLYNLFGYYQSTPMVKENFNVALDGRNILTFRNVNNDATKLSVSHDTWGQAVFVTNGHIHANKSVLIDLSGSPLNGFASYGCVELNSFVDKELAMTYRRFSDNNTLYPTVAEQLIINAIAEVKCMLVKGEKVYL